MAFAPDDDGIYSPPDPVSPTANPEIDTLIGRFDSPGEQSVEKLHRLIAGGSGNRDRLASR